MEEQRFNFSDYPAKEQEQDAKRNQAKAEQYFRRELYVMRVNGNWGAIMPKKRHNVIFAGDTGVELEEFINEVKKDLEKWHIKPRFHCVRNFGIENKIAEHQKDFEKLQQMKEFNER